MKNEKKPKTLKEACHDISSYLKKYGLEGYDTLLEISNNDYDGRYNVRISQHFIDFVNSKNNSK